jgi:hypothetical protein
LPRANPTHVVVLATLGAPQRRRLPTRRRRRAEPLPAPIPVSTSRATIIDVGQPCSSLAQAARWLSGAGEPELEAGVAVLNRALLAFRLLTADPYVNPIHRRQALVARLGYGAGEEVADGRWRDALELAPPAERRRRERALRAQAGLAAALGGRRSMLVCEELALRARLDLDLGRDREAALQLGVALDTALAELPAGPGATGAEGRLAELRRAADGVSAAGRAALTRGLSEEEREALERALTLLERAIRATAAP